MTTLLLALLVGLATGLIAFAQIGGASAPEILTAVLALWAGVALASIALSRATID